MNDVGAKLGVGDAIKKSLRREAWLAGQNEAFKAAVNGAPLEQSLQVLIDTARGLVRGLSQCAFYIANEEGTALHRVAGMTASSTEKSEGFVNGAEGLTGAFATSTAAPVLTPGVREEPRWKDLVWLAQERDCGGCWSFPVETSGGNLVGSFAWYLVEPRSPKARDLEIAQSLCGTASIIIAHHQNLSRLRKSEERLSKLVELMPAAVYTCDAGGRITYFNRRAAELWGREPRTGDDQEKFCGSFRMWTPAGAVLNHAECPMADAVRDGRSARNLEVVVEQPTGARVVVNVNIDPLYDRDRRLVGAINVFTDVTERKRAEAALQRSERHATTLLAELQHRVRNTLAVVRSIARRTADNSRSADDMLSHFQGRLDAFSRVQAALTRGPNATVDLASLIEDELVAHAARGGEQVGIDGPAIALDPKTAERLSLAIHELTTNAVKYGALIDGHGKVNICWRAKRNGTGEQLELDWVESGIKLDAAQMNQDGFGMELLRRSLPYDLGAETRIELTPEGLRFQLRVPLREPASGTKEVKTAL